MRLGIAGASGRVGRLLVELIGRDGLDLSGGLSRSGAMPDGVHRFDSIAALADNSDVVIDFTHADSVADHGRALAGAGVAWVLGTTGLSPAAQLAVQDAAAQIAVVQAANFSPGVTLVIEMARRLAAALPAERYDAEILEMHHRQKVDAPSGTALAIGEAVAGARGQSLDAVRESGRDGQTGPRAPGAVGFASLRGGQIVGEHTLLFTAAGEQIVLTHRALDRRLFAEGAIRAALWTAGRPPGLYGMEHVLDLR